jgi:type IV pilus assembly protein PilW
MKRRSAAQRGFTLIELLVAVAIGTALTLVVTVMLARHESARRALTNANDASQSGAYVAYSLDRMLRSAGSGFVQGWNEAFGCRINAARGGVPVLPRSSAFPAPFASLPLTIFLAPVVVHAGAGAGGSDVIVVATGAGGMGESPLPLVVNTATASSVLVPATTGLRGGDLVLVHDGSADCMVQQVATGFVGGASQTLNFGGTYAAGTMGSAVLVNYFTTASPVQAYVSHLGNVSGNQPMFTAIGVGDNATLVSHDLLRLDGGSDAIVPIADGVADLRVRYGIDLDGNGTVDEWASPGASPWDAPNLHNGTGTKQEMKKILALRLAVVTRNSVPERTAVSPATLTLFPDLAAPLQVARPLNATEQTYRWRVLDFVVPLRNVALAPAP